MESVDAEQDEDGVGLVQDFEKAKKFISFDPYGGSETGLSEDTVLEQSLTALKYEDKFKLRASIVLSTYQKQLDEVNYESLSYEDKERFNKVKSLLTYLNGVKIIDAPVLLKIYNLHRMNV